MSTVNTAVAHHEGVLMIQLPGLTAVYVDTRRRVIAVDHQSGATDTGIEPEWAVHDLRDGVYGDFHRLMPADRCNDSDCPRDQHVDVAELVALVRRRTRGARRARRGGPAGARRCRR